MNTASAALVFGIVFIKTAEQLTDAANSYARGLSDSGVIEGDSRGSSPLRRRPMRRR